jgi:hypothetical protein
MSGLKYVAIKDVEQYVKQFGRLNSEQQLVHMVNWFAEGAITSLSNKIMEGGELLYTRADGCRCGSCNEWQIVDYDGAVLARSEDLAGFLKDSE